MPLLALVNLLPKYYPSRYQIHIALSIVAIFVIRAYAQGRSTNRDRDLHGRVILLTGAFTSIGSTLMEALAQRGAHIIALTHLPIEAPEVALLVDAVRDTTKNERIFAEQCDFASVESVRAFCTKFLTGKEHRLDAIIFAHEYEHVGPIFSSKAEELACEERRAVASDGTFLMMTLLLPTLLVAPPERDIRIINVINPFYAAAVPSFPTSPPVNGSNFLREGHRSLRAAVLMRHLQRVLDALPQAPAPDPFNASAAAASKKSQKSNIVAMSVSPGFSRHDTFAPLLRANHASSEFSFFGLILYILLQPILRILAKSPSQSPQSILHALFLPTPFKLATMTKSETTGPENDDDTPPEEVLKPGALYSDCSIVRIDLRDRVQHHGNSDEKQGEFSKADLPDDGEYGGEALGRFVWETFEEALKNRERKFAEGTPVTTTDQKTE
ncbi:hypothetical protein EW145_g1998 [Phellinidium pouzarii]|uniref:Ketoreductase (KR) domain-containing protein n=1 Tax=Phellinidium pouzarii TaxID=167371 RepID=A0A4S4LE81_9AGAM|nr:hypothetical protein EW145_g1998 [Phellinidium pouzarii]